MPSPGSHRRRRSHVGRHRVQTPPKGVPLPGLLLAASLAGSAVLFTSSGTASTPPAADPLQAVDITSALNERSAAVDEKALTRAFERAPAPSPSPSPSPAEQPPKPAVPAPVAGLVQAQMNNAATIVRVGQSINLPRRALIIGVATAMQESNLYNTASSAVPESFNYPYEGSSTDHDSVGIFQQRPSQGWGSVADLMRPEYQAGKFFDKLSQINWQNMSLTQAAQTVQVSAYPDAYAKHESRATTIVDALL